MLFRAAKVRSFLCSVQSPHERPAGGRWRQAWEARGARRQPRLWLGSQAATSQQPCPKAKGPSYRNLVSRRRRRISIQAFECLILYYYYFSSFVLCNGHWMGLERSTLVLHRSGSVPAWLWDPAGIHSPSNYSTADTRK